MPQNIDKIALHFNQDSLTFLNFLLAFIMFGVALDLKLEDFKRLLQNPKASLLGIFSQLFLLPFLTYLLVLVLRPQPSVALGMILVAACPGGNISNFISNQAKANTALSVSLTSVSTLLSVFMTPINFRFYASIIPGGAGAVMNSISLDFMDMFTTILLLILLPIAIGILFKHYFPKLTEKINKPIKTLSIIIFAFFVIGALVVNYDNFMNYVQVVFFLVLLHNGTALASGYYLGKIGGLEERDCRAISIETGIQNSGLGLVLIFNFFNGLGGMALIAAWWGVWHIISGMAISWFWARKTKRAELNP